MRLLASSFRTVRTVVAAAITALGLLPSASAQTVLNIHDIMQKLPASPYLGQNVQTSGIVVGVMSSGAYYLTNADGNWLAKPGTTAAEGIEIYSATGANPLCAVVGAAVTVTGVVTNGTAVNGAGTPGTGIAPTSCTVTGVGAITKTVTLPTASAFSSDYVYTGMPAANTVYYAISPTSGTLDPSTGLVTSTGQFWSDFVLPANNHLFKSTGLELDEFYPLPPAPQGTIPRWSGNPQRLLIDSTTFGGAPIDIGAGQNITCKAGTGLTVGAVNGLGVIDYSLGYNRLLLFKTTTCTIAGSIATSVTAPADTQHFHAATINLNMFHNAANSPQITEPSGLTYYQSRVQKAAIAIVNVLGRPDILSVQEVEDLKTLQDIGDAASALTTGGTTSYQAYLMPANDATNLSIGFLINTVAVYVPTVPVQLFVTDPFTKLDGTTEPLWERPPYVLNAQLLRGGLNYLVTVVNLDITERAGIDNQANGYNIWERRAQQAVELSKYADAQQKAQVNLLIVGEFNAYSFSDGFADPTDIIAGNSVPANGTVAQYEPTYTTNSMYNFVGSLMGGTVYNIIENGNARSVEHILCSQTQSASASGSLYNYIYTVTQPHFTTDFPAVDANDFTIAAGLTGRDGFVSAFAIPPVPTTATLTPSTLNFGSVYRTQSSAPMTLTFTNTSVFVATVTVSNIAFSGSNPGDFSQTSNCATLNQGQSCTINVVFSPLGAGPRNATITVTSDSGAEPMLSATLSGTGVDTSASLTPSSATYAATDIGATTAPQVFTFTNTSPLPETISSATASGDFSVSANTCGGTTAAGGTCTVSVVFAPTVAGTRTGTLTVNNSSTLNAALTASLTGTGLDTTATLTPAAGTFPSTFLGASSTAVVFTYTNTSLVNETVSAAAVTGDYSITSNTCAGPIAASATCTISVIFTPTATGARTGTLTVNDSSTGNPVLTATLTGTGLDTTATLTPATATFANTFLGATSPALVFTYTNTSTVAETVSSAAVTGDYSISANTCTGAIAGSGTCTVSVVFKPTATGTRTGTLTLKDSSTGNPTLTATLTGTGLDTTATLTPTTGTFANTFLGATSPAVVFTFTNTSTVAETVSRAAVTGDYSITANTCTTPIAGSGTCTVSVTFKPTAVGTRTGTLTLTDSSTGNPTLTSALTGTGLDTTASLTPATGTFASADIGATSPALTFTFTNTSTVSETATGASVTGDYSITANTCTAVTVPAAGTCTVSVVFMPTAAGTRMGTLTVANSSTANPAVTSALTGIGLDTTATLTPTTADFGSVDINGGVSAAKLFTVTNTSTVAINVGAINVSTNFTQTNTCGATLSAGATCTVSVIFAPLTVGPLTGTLTVANSSTGNPLLTSTLTGTGLNTTATLTPASASFGSVSVGGGTSVPVAFTVTNTSTIALSLGAINVSTNFTQTSTCGATLSAGASCTVSVVFAPQNVGPLTGTLTVANSSTANPTLTATLTGTGLATTATLAPLTATFPQTVVSLSSPPQTFTWTNTSVVPLTINSVTTTGDFGVSSTSCKGSIAAGASCTSAVVFTPSVIGARTGTFTVSSSSTANGTLTATLSGTGVSDLESSVSSLDFGNVYLNANLHKSFFLTNHSAAPITLTGIVVAGSEFTSTNSCGTVLTAGFTCEIGVTFAPTVLGPATGTLTISTNDPKAPQIVVILTGNGVDFALTLNPTSGHAFAGTSTSFYATLTPLDGYTGQPLLHCVLPANMGGTVCGIHMTTPALGPNGGTQIDISTTAPYTVIGYYGGLGGGLSGRWGALLALFTLLSAGLLAFGRRRPLRLASLAAMLVLLGFAGLGCSGKYPEKNADPTLPGTYAVTIVAEDYTLTHSATFTLSVTDK